MDKDTVMLWNTTDLQIIGEWVAHLDGLAKALNGVSLPFAIIIGSGIIGACLMVTAALLRPPGSDRTQPKHDQ